MQSQMVAPAAAGHDLSEVQKPVLAQATSEKEVVVHFLSQVKSHAHPSFRPAQGRCPGGHPHGSPHVGEQAVEAAGDPSRGNRSTYGGIGHCLFREVGRIRGVAQYVGGPVQPADEPGGRTGI